MVFVSQLCWFTKFDLSVVGFFVECCLFGRINGCGFCDAEFFSLCLFLCMILEGVWILNPDMYYPVWIGLSNKIRFSKSEAHPFFSHPNTDLNSQFQLSNHNPCAKQLLNLVGCYYGFSKVASFYGHGFCWGSRWRKKFPILMVVLSGGCQFKMYY